MCPDFRQTETFDVIITLQHGLCLSAHKTLFLCVCLVFVKISKCFDSLLNALTKCGTTTTDRNANSIATDFFLLCLLIPFSRFFSPVHLSGFHHVLYSLFISPFPHYISFPFLWFLLAKCCSLVSNFLSFLLPSSWCCSAPCQTSESLRLLNNCGHRCGSCSLFVLLCSDLDIRFLLVTGVWPLTPSCWRLNREKNGGEKKSLLKVCFCLSTLFTHS